MTEILLNNEWLLIIFVILILYLGWRIRKAWKNFLFYLIKRKGRKGEGTAVKLLNKEGYEIIDEQVSFPGFLFENNNKIEYETFKSWKPFGNDYCPQASSNAKYGYLNFGKWSDNLYPCKS